LRASCHWFCYEIVSLGSSIEVIVGYTYEYKFVPLRNDVGNRATSVRLTERNTTVHATSRLVLQLVLVKARGKLSPVASPGLGSAVLLSTPLVLHEALGLVENESGALLLGGAVLDALFDVEEVALLALLLTVVVRVRGGRLANRSTGDDRKRVSSLLCLGSLLGLLLDDTLVIGGQNLDEARQSAVEVEENASSELRTGVVVVVLDQATHESDLMRVLDAAELNHLLVDLALEVLVDVENVSNTSRHTSGEIATSAAKAENTTTCHVLATVVTHTLNNGSDTGVADSETLGSHTAEEAGTSSSAVETDVTDDHVLLGLEDGGTRWVDDQATTGQTLSNVVVAVTLKLESDTRSKECTERLTGRATNVGVDGVLRQALLTILLADLVGEGGAKSTVGVDNIALNAAGQTLLEGQLGLGDELVVETNVELVVLLANVVCRNTRTQCVGGSKDQRQVDVLGLCVPEILADLEHLSVANHLVNRPVTKLGHDGAQLVGNVVEEVDDMFGRTLELLAELGILGGDTDGAGVLLGC
jgi:hypothetical protein